MLPLSVVLALCSRKNLICDVALTCIAFISLSPTSLHLILICYPKVFMNSAYQLTCIAFLIALTHLTLLGSLISLNVNIFANFLVSLVSWSLEHRSLAISNRSRSLVQRVISRFTIAFAPPHPYLLPESILELQLITLTCIAFLIAFSHLTLLGSLVLMLSFPRALFLCRAKRRPLDFFHTKSTLFHQLVNSDFSSYTQPIENLSIWVARLGSK
jgi:hypothetical protein